jgi:hypothetical protein
MNTYPPKCYALTSMMRVLSLTALIVIVLVLYGHSSFAQTQNSNSNSNANPPANSNTSPGGAVNTSTNTVANTTALAARATTLVPCPSAESYQQVAVTKAYKSGRENELNVRLGDEITVEIPNLKTLQDRARCQIPARKIVLFLDQRPVKDAIPFPPTDPNKPSLNFQLKPNETSRDVWTYILGEAKWQSRDVNVSVGLEDEHAVESPAIVKLKVIPENWFFFWAIIFVAIGVIFGLLAYRSDLLRDSGPPPTLGGRKPYSLARTQAAWWFFLILAAYLFIGIITGDFSTSITTTVLGLLGISAGTVVGSAFVDAGKAAATAPAVGPPQPTFQGKYWWVDILSDANGVSFHRFQMAAWSLVLGIIFVIQVYQSLAMPTFSGTLLSIMGISAGTYLGLKIPEPT